MGWYLYNDIIVLKYVKRLAVNFTCLNWRKWGSTWLKLNWKLFLIMVTVSKSVYVLKYMLFYAATISSNTL